MPKNYRKGGLGALQDEYERASSDLFLMLENMSDDDYYKHRPEESEELNTIQKIMFHVIGSAFGYINKIRKTIGVAVTIERPKELFTKEEAIVKLRSVIAYTAESFEGKWMMTDEELDRIKLQTPWNVEYSIEQMMEHAIVHILRHRRQIERILKI